MVSLSSKSGDAQEEEKGAEEKRGYGMVSLRVISKWIFILVFFDRPCFLVCLFSSYHQSMGLPVVFVIVIVTIVGIAVCLRQHREHVLFRIPWIYIMVWYCMYVSCTYERVVSPLRGTRSAEFSGWNSKHDSHYAAPFRYSIFTGANGNESERILPQ